MNVVFRADASIQIGTGHIIRCATLGEWVRKEGAEVSFICREQDGHLCDYLMERGFLVHRLVTPQLCELRDTQRKSSHGSATYEHWLGVAQEVDAAQTIEHIKGLGIRPDWLIVDHYALNISWEQALREHVDRIMVIDDLANRYHNCDALLDQNLCKNYNSRYVGLVQTGCTMLLGPAYALLRPEFRERREGARERYGCVRRILVFFGGSDSARVTEKAVRAINSLGRADISIDVVVGGANPQHNMLKVFCDTINNVTFHHQVSHMAELMEAADLFVGAAGSITWEHMALGLPSMVVTVAENQVPIATHLGQIGMLYYVGKADDSADNIIEQKLATAVDYLINDKSKLMHYSQYCKQLVDAKGTQRVVDVLCEAVRH